MRLVIIPLPFSRLSLSMIPLRMAQLKAPASDDTNRKIKILLGNFIEIPPY